MGDRRPRGVKPLFTFPSTTALTCQKQYADASVANPLCQYQSDIQCALKWSCHVWCSPEIIMFAWTMVCLKCRYHMFCLHIIKWIYLSGLMSRVRHVHSLEPVWREGCATLPKYGMSSSGSRLVTTSFINTILYRLNVPALLNFPMSYLMSDFT